MTAWTLENLPQNLNKTFKYETTRPVEQSLLNLDRLRHEQTNRMWTTMKIYEKLWKFTKLGKSNHKDWIQHSPTQKPWVSLAYPLLHWHSNPFSVLRQSVLAWSRHGELWQLSTRRLQQKYIKFVHYSFWELGRYRFKIFEKNIFDIP